MNKLLSIIAIFLAFAVGGRTAEAATASATVTAKVFLPITLQLVDPGKFVFNIPAGQTTNPGFTGDANVDQTFTVFPKIKVTGDKRASFTVSVSPVTYMNGATTVLTGNAFVGCSASTTGSFPTSPCTVLSNSGVTNIWISTKSNTTSTPHTINVVNNLPGKFTATALQLTVDY